MVRGASGTVSVAPVSARAALYDEGTLNLINEPIYADEGGDHLLPNPMQVAVDGSLDFWLTNERVLDVVVSCHGYVDTRVTVTADAAGDRGDGGGITLPLNQHLTFAPDNTFDLGDDGARPRDLLLGRNAIVPGTLTGGIVDRGGQVYNVKAFGALGNGSTDDTDALQAALTAAHAAGGGTVLVPVGTYVLTDTLDWTRLANVVLEGVGQMDQRLAGSVLKWNGLADGTMHKLHEARGDLIENISMINGTSIPGVYVDMDQPPGYIQNCTHNTLRRCLMRRASIAAVRIGNLANANCDLNRFDDVIIEGPSPAGFLFLDSQSKFNFIEGGSITNCAVGIDCKFGSFTSISTNFSSNTIDVQLGNPADAIAIIQPQSESAQRFLHTPDMGGSAWAVSIIGGRLSVNNVHADGRYLQFFKPGPLNLFGIDFADGIEHLSVRFYVGAFNPTQVNAIGCVLPNSTPWLPNSTGASIRQIGCIAPDSGGVGKQVSDRWDGMINFRQMAVWTKSGAPVDADFSSPTNGMLTVDTTNNRLYVRSGSTWKYLTLT